MLLFYGGSIEKNNLACQFNIDHKMCVADCVYFGLKDSVFDRYDYLFLSGRNKWPGKCIKDVWTCEFFE
jgi:hypothetical protein